MDSFLQIVASDVFKKYPMDMHEVCILFPNRRAGIFFNKYLAQLINRPVWAPQIRSIGDLMQEFSGLQQGDPLTLLYSLYQVYGEVNHSDESFDDFYYWGEMLISDFDDIDKYLADPGQIFQNLADIKEIDRQFTIPEEKMQLILEFWNHFNINDKSTLKQNFTAIWEKLLEVYENYRTVLYKRKIGYEGMMYRDVVTKIQTNRLINPNYKSYVIAGFNALNECEKALFTYLKNN